MVPTAPAIPGSVERFFEFSLLGFLTSGFLAVASSGQLDLPTTLLTAIGLLMRGLNVAGILRFDFTISWVNAVTIAYIGFYPLDYLYISREFLPATVHLIFFLAVVRVLSAHTNRDYFFVKTIAFLELLAASVISSGLSFFLFLAMFLVFGVATFASSEIRRATFLPNRMVRGGMKSFHWRLSALTAYAAVGILIMTAGMFFILPRTARAAFRHLVAERYHLPGFSNEVRLGQIGEIKQSSTPVMHIKLDPGIKQPLALKWRGSALSTFDGKRWYTPPSAGEAIRSQHQTFALAEPRQRPAKGVRVIYEVLMAAIDSDALFFSGIPEFIRIDVPLVIRTSVDSYRTGLGFSDGIHYFGYSYLPENAAAAAYNTGALPISLREAYTQLPPLDPRIFGLTREITAGQNTELSRAKAIETYLRTQYGYTTQLLSAEVDDPLSYFLFERKKGHCEYFASAMTVMLRALRIPARVVTGFQSGVYNPMTGWQLVRASDAHSWVEGFVPGQGWTTFDPTPPDPNNVGASWLSQWSLYLDAADTFWQEWVLNYNLDRQLSLAARVDQSGRSISLNWYDQIGAKLKALTAAGVETGKRFVSAIVAILALLAFVLFCGPQCLGWLRSRLQSRRFRRGRIAAHDAAILYSRMLAILKRRGFEKPAWLTPAEFARVLPPSSTADIVSNLTSAYHDLRYAGRPEAGARILQLLQELETIV